MAQPLFIAFEGIDGSGKSTQVKLLVDRLKESGQKVHTTCEPTDSPIGSIIRNIFKHRIEGDHRTIAGLFIADRLDHLLNSTDGMLKKLKEGITVVSDRYYFSSYAYQGTHMSLDWVIEGNSQSADLLRPHLNIYIDISPEISMQRINKGRNSAEMYETIDNLNNVRDKYFEAFEKLHEKEHVLIVDGNRAPEVIANEIWDAVSALS